MQVTRHAGDETRLTAAEGSRGHTWDGDCWRRADRLGEEQRARVGEMQERDRVLLETAPIIN